MSTHSLREIRSRITSLVPPIDARHAGVDERAGDRVLQHVAIAAMQLHHLVDAFHIVSVANSLAIAASSSVSLRSMCSAEVVVDHRRTATACALMSASLNFVFWKSHTVWSNALRSFT